MVTDAMSKREIEDFKLKQTDLATSEKSVIDPPKRKPRKPKNAQ